MQSKILEMLSELDMVGGRVEACVQRLSDDKQTLELEAERFEKFIATLDIGTGMQVFVRNSAGQMESLTVGLDMTVESVKAALYNKKHRLSTSDGKQLEDGRTVEYYNIQKQSTLQEVSRLDAGAKRGRQPGADDNQGKQVKADKRQQVAEAQRMLRGMLFEMDGDANIVEIVAHMRVLIHEGANIPALFGECIAALPKEDIERLQTLTGSGNVPYKLEAMAKVVYSRALGHIAAARSRLDTTIQCLTKAPLVNYTVER